MKILVVGCGTFGSNVAVEMEFAGHDVVIVESVYENFERLPDTFHGKKINGDALAKDVLERAHASAMNAVILTTASDSLNLTLARMFKDKFQIEKIVALNTQPVYRSLFDQMGIQTVSMINWGVLRIEEKLSQPAGKDTLSLNPEAVNVYNVVIPDHGTFSAKELMKVPQCLIFSITRDNRTMFFTDQFTVTPGDILHVSANSEGLRNLFLLLGLDTKGVQS